MKFGMMMHISPPNTTKKVKFCKAKMADSRRLENCRITISAKPFSHLYLQFVVDLKDFQGSKNGTISKTVQD